MPRFRLLSGIHNEGGKTYFPGDVFDSACDLSKYPYNRENAFRFERVPNGAVNVEDRLESMTIAQLKEFAAEEEIELGDAVRRDEILRLCKGESIAPAVA